MEDDACRTDGEERSPFDHPPFTVAEDFIVDESAGVRRSVAQHIPQPPVLVAADGDGAVRHVHAGVDRLYRAVDGVSFHVAADDILSHLQRDDLPEMKYILDDVQ